ncbi:MAG: hypothetical protein H6765_06245 [Candidatus Peribacteria bacterium]|nr:MAG: hypothetical protein H6765_06245 [Candidatus Peribacteria bacterium]
MLGGAKGTAILEKLHIKTLADLGKFAVKSRGAGGKFVSRFDQIVEMLDANKLFEEVLKLAPRNADELISCLGINSIDKLQKIVGAGGPMALFKLQITSAADIIKLIRKTPSVEELAKL